MICKNCGKEVDDRAVFCPQCKAQFIKVKDSTVGKTSGLAIAGFVLSFLISIAGLICSVIAYKKCRAENLGGSGLALAGIIISISFIGLTLLINIVSCGISCALGV